MTKIPQKICFIIILIGFLAVAYANGDAKDVPIDQIESTLKSSTELTTSMEKCKPIDLMHFFGLNYQDFDDTLYYKNTQALGVQELLIIKVKNKSSITSVVDVMEERVNSQLALFEGYGPEQVSLLSNKIIKAKGHYIFYCVDSTPEAYWEVFRSVI